MSRAAFTNGQILMAEQLQSVHDQGGVEVATVNEMNALPVSVKVCWYAGSIYRRLTNNAWWQEGADKVPGYPSAIMITDWNLALNTGFYMSQPGALNAPIVSIGNAWFIGFVVRYHDGWVHQVAWPLGEAMYPWGVTGQRARRDTVWTTWDRINAYNYSWGALDNLTYLHHGSGGPEGHGVRRFSHGMKKDAGSNGATNADEWRIQCYDTAGNYTRTALTVHQNGAVMIPGTRIALNQEVNSSQVLTVGALKEILDNVLTPAQKTKLNTILNVVGDDDGSN